MKNAPQWTPEFLKECAALEKFMGWSEGVVIEDLTNAIDGASRSELEDGLRNDYLCLSFNDEERVNLGPYRADVYAVTIYKDDMTNWDEFISTRLTMLRLGVCDED